MNKTITKAYKFRFYPQSDLVILLAKTFGCTRFIYNKAFDYSEQHYLTKFLDNNPLNKSPNNINPEYKSLSSIDRINYISVLKKTTKLNEETQIEELAYLWLNEVSSIALQQSVKHLNTSYDRFFKHISAKPNFKKKLNRNSFTITGKNSLHFDKDFIKNKLFYLPKYNSHLNIKFSRNFNHMAVSSVTISQEPSGKYYISFLVKKDSINVKPVQNINQNVQQKTSIDLGLKTHAKVFNGSDFINANLPELIKDIDKKLRKSQRELSRKVKGSNNRDKQRIKVAKLHEKKNNILTDYYHKLSSKIINENQVIIRENLNIAGMKKNRKLSHAIHNVAWGKFLHMLDYKAEWYEREVIIADRYYASSKICSKCGHMNKELKLSERQWDCKSCNANHDRDENACLNLYNYDDSIFKQMKLKSKTSKSNNKTNSTNSSNLIKSKTAVGTTVDACGGDVSSESLNKNVTLKNQTISREAGISCLKAGVVQAIMKQLLRNKNGF